MLNNYNNFLLEYKNLGSLYHIIDFEKLFYILNNNVISSYKFSNISFTRDKMMNGYLGDSPTSIFKLEIDGDKISQNYKVNPFSFISNTNIRFDEREEQVKTREIKNAFKYIKKIILIKKRVEYLKNESSWFTSDGGYFKSDRTPMQLILKSIYELIKEKGFDLYIQDGTVIKKEDDYILSLINSPIVKIPNAYGYYYRGHEKMDDKEFGHYKEVTIPLDSRNEEIKELVIGWDYQNIWLLKNKPNSEPKEKIDFDKKKYVDMKLYIFDFIYENQDILKEDGDYVLIDSGKLKHIYMLNDIIDE